MSAATLLVALAFYVAAAELALGWGFIGAVASPPALALLAGAALLTGMSAARAARARDVPAWRRWSRALVRGGLALTMAALPASLALRDARTVTAGEGEELRPGWSPAIRFGEVRLAPRGPHLLSKKVEIEALVDGDPSAARIGLFPPTSLAGRRWSVFRFGYAPGFALSGPRGEELAAGYVKLGTLPQSEESASLVEWTPETNLMMGAGTFPPRLEDLVSPPRAGHHVFLRLVEAKLGGARRDLTDPEAYRWLLDGRPEDPVFFAQVFRGRERVFEGRVRAGETARFEGGTLELAPELLLWVDLLAVRDPWLPAAFAGLVLVVAGAALAAGSALARRIGRRSTPRS